MAVGNIVGKATTVGGTVGAAAVGTTLAVGALDGARVGVATGVDVVAAFGAGVGVPTGVGVAADPRASESARAVTANSTTRV